MTLQTSQLISILLISSVFAWQADDCAAQGQRLSIEQLHAEATANAKKESAEIAKKTEAYIAIFKFQGQGSALAHESARKKLIAMGFGAVPHIAKCIHETTNSSILNNLNLTLRGMYAAKTAKRDEIATPLRNLIEAKEPRQAATVIAILGSINDRRSVDAIRRQSERKTPLVQAAVILAVAELDPERCFSELEAAAKSGDAALRRAAAEAYGLVGRNPQDQRIMVSLVKDDDDRVALEALRSLKRISVNTKAMTALHEALKHSDPRFIRVAIQVIEQIGKKEYSGRHLLGVTKNTALPMDLRKAAAKALFRLKDKDGMMELAKSYKAQIRNQPRSVRAHEALASFYVEFEAWELAAKTYMKALDLSRNGTQQNTMRMEIARCWARASKFKRAASYLKKAGRENYWQDLANDPAFSEMKKDKRYGKNFME